MAGNRVGTRNFKSEGEIVRTHEKHPVESPLWWVTRLYQKLIDRRDKLTIYDDYYRGDFPLPWLAPQAEDEFRRIMRLARANYCGLVIDAMVERMTVEGFRIDTGQGDRSAPIPIEKRLDPQAVITGAIGSVTQGKSLSPATLAQMYPGSIGTTRSSNYIGTTIGEADRETWRIWQANNMDKFFDQALLEVAINGMAYLMVSPNDEDPSTPKIWVEHPTQCIVEYEPGSQRQEIMAGLKVWEDDIRKVTCATLYLPGSIHKFQAKNGHTPHLPSGVRWEPRIVDGEAWPARTSLDYVPIFELANNERILTGGHSEIYDVMDTQDRIVKTIADRLMTQDYGAFPQKWAKAWPETDASGAPTRKIDVGRDRMITTDVAEADFGQFDAADLRGYMLAKKEDVHDMAARTRTPAQYLLGEFSNVNGETLKASESGLVAKVRQRIRGIDDDLEQAIRALRTLAGIDTEDDITMETVWRNPEFKTEGEHVDALQKMSTLGVPEQALWERWGASQPEIQRRIAMQQEQRAAQAEMDIMGLLSDTMRKESMFPGPPGSAPTKKLNDDTPRRDGRADNGQLQMRDMSGKFGEEVDEGLKPIRRTRTRRG